MTDSEVAVVGGGITGLALAHYLDGYDVDFTLFESSSEPGGVMRSKEVDGRVLDLGPQRTRLTPQVEALVDDLGLEDRVLTASEDLPLYIYHDGELRLAPTTLSEALHTDLFSWKGKLRMLMEPLKSIDGGGYSTAEEFMRERFGDEAYVRMLGPLYGGVYASDPGEMPYTYSVGRLLDERGVDGSVLAWAAKKSLLGGSAPAACSFEGGMQELAHALVESHAEDVVLDSPVESVKPVEDEEDDAPGGSGGRWSVEVEGERRVFDRVVVATAADAAAEMLGAVDRGSAGALAELNYNEVAVVHVDCDWDVEGLGFQSAYGEDVEIVGATFVDSMFGRRDVFTCYLGGGRRPGVLERPDVELGEVAASELEDVVGGDAEPLHVHRVRMPAYDSTWRRLEDLGLPEGVDVVGSYLSRPGIPGRLREAVDAAEDIASAM